MMPDVPPGSALTASRYVSQTMHVIYAHLLYSFGGLLMLYALDTHLVLLMRPSTALGLVLVHSQHMLWVQTHK